MCYAQIELFVRGVTYLPMTFIGGLAGVLIGLVHKRTHKAPIPMWAQCLLGMLITLDVEFISGCLFNRHWGMNLWDYTGYSYNLEGQICLRLAVAWFFLMPFALWVNDLFRWKFFDEQKPFSPFKYYKQLLLLR
jgi:Predicted membrane protein